MPNLNDFDNNLGGNEIIQPYDGLGNYNAFPVDNIGGGGQYQPPVPPNNTFVPPSYVQNNFGELRIFLNSTEPAEFLENGISIGFGVSQQISFNPSLTFGNSRTYTINSLNKIAKNYFTITIQKTYRPFRSEFEVIGGTSNIFFNDLSINNLSFYNQREDLTRNDILYTENIVVTTFTYNEFTKEYEITDVNEIGNTSGTVNLNFDFLPIATIDRPIDSPIELPTDNETIEYNVNFVSNYTNEIGQFIKLKYQIVSSTNDILDTDDLFLDDGNIDPKSIKKSILSNSKINFEISEVYTNPILVNQNNLPEGFSYSEFYWAPKSIADRFPTDYSKWNLAGKAFNVSGQEFLSEITIAVIFEKTERVITPTISIGNFIGEYEVKDSELDKNIVIPFTTENADFVDVYISNNDPIRVSASIGFIELSFVNDFERIFGSKKIYLVPVNQFGIGNTKEIVIKINAVNDFPSIIQIESADSIDVPAFSDLNVEFDVSYTTFAATSVDIFVLKEDNSKNPILTSQPANGSFKVNLKTIVEKFLDGKKLDLTFVFVPYNRGGVRELVGNPYEVKTKINYPQISINEDEIKSALFETMFSTFGFADLAEESKYLTHLVNFGNNEQILISSWEEDDWTLSDKVEDELGNLVIKNKVDSILLKLYSPLPASIVTNSTFWITKLITNPLIETVVLTKQDNIECPPIKGPNFSIEYDFSIGQSTNFETLDDLILSSSVSASSTLVANYLSSSLINLDGLNVEYTDGSSYLWENFTHFSSAKERVDNFVYKIQLIEAYETSISQSNYDPLIIGHSLDISAGKEREKQQIKKEKVIQSFDGFEQFLYTSSSFTDSNSNSITWPYVNGNRVLSTDVMIIEWYNNIVDLAEQFDIENPNFILNNIPQYIRNYGENESLLLFFSMIGHHFDNIYFYTKAIENSRNKGYKKQSIAEKLLFDTLKSFGWDAKNLAADSKLWEYVMGLDSDGNQKNKKSPKDRTYEIWRRIINNLPYLLKNKGTRRGIYALMACYGIPSSNLSILEFGGPEAANRFSETTEIGTTKVTLDTTTYVLNFDTSSKIELDWKNTDKGEKPKTIETFIKPVSAGNWTVISNSNGWDISVSGSNGSEYGKIIINDNSSTILESELLPIFNGRFFGISVSSGSFGIKLDTKQVDGEREIFEKSYTENTTIDFESDGILSIGPNYSGSIDEFRLWSTPLSSSAFYKHVFFPEAINGNHISSSTEDLYFRLDFEYPKPLHPTAEFINVDTNIYFSSSVTRNQLEDGIIPIQSDVTIFSETTNAIYSASVIDFPFVSEYPYNFEALERTVTMEVPNIGSTRYSSNKVRFESQTDIFGNDVTNGIDLSIKSRATKKAFDQSPADSNRVGLFFSPTKELNTDIIKSFGGINLDDYIGDPSDEYRSNYKSLDRLRNYYFERFDGRDIYAYINLIKVYEKSLFEDIKKMLPARVRATTGLLIEPHILERSKIEQSKPTGEDYQQESLIDTTKHILTQAEANQIETIVNANLSENVFGENNQFEALISTASIQKTIAENYQQSAIIDSIETFETFGENYQKEVLIKTELDKSNILTEIDLINSNIIVGQSELENLGFGIYAQNGIAIRTYFDAANNIVKERVRVNLITEEKQRVVERFAITASNGFGDPRGGFVSDLETYRETTLNIAPLSGSTVPSVGGNIVDVKLVNGYLPTHYRNTTDLTRGLKNSYYLGSKNTAATTLDGSSPVETFTTNPNTLRVNRAGRDASEPILEVE